VLEIQLREATFLAHDTGRHQGSEAAIRLKNGMAYAQANDRWNSAVNKRKIDSLALRHRILSRFYSMLYEIFFAKLASRIEIRSYRS